ncbi:alanine transaminase [Blastocladiella emersonii ATCC 22665]|nr:alanine transaminase [Blastocladiella emersonii ATCC 22665]
MTTSAVSQRAHHTGNGNGPHKKIMTLDNLNPYVKQAQYAVRGELAIRADQLRKQLDTNPGSLPFTQITNCNIGNPQQLKQPPITFLRQVSSLLEYPALLDERNAAAVSALFPADAVARARSLTEAIGGSVGAYSHSQGIPAIRANVAQFIAERDGHPANPDHIFLTAGASPGVQAVLQAIISHDKVGILIPIPQYPLYTATIGLCNGRAVPYYLNETKGWSLEAAEVRRAVREARAEGTEVRALCVINPGNPTGNVLSRADMEDLVTVCREEGLVLLADEVYQTNVYYPESKPWFSFKKVVCDMGAQDDIELISFHSISKGMIGECGRRGGYFECVGIDPAVLDQLYKIASISLCPNVQGQVAVDLMVAPPKKGDASYDVYTTEMTYLYESLKRRAAKLSAAFNELEGVSCERAEGAMYLFPRIHLPAKAEAAAKAAGKPADAFYTLALLDATGVCMVPGSGFLQEPGTWHFRSTFLPPEDQLDEFISKIGTFHAQFMDKYRD